MKSQEYNNIRNRYYTLHIIHVSILLAAISSFSLGFLLRGIRSSRTYQCYLHPRRCPTVRSRYFQYHSMRGMYLSMDVLTNMIVIILLFF